MTAPQRRTRAYAAALVAAALAVRLAWLRSLALELDELQHAFTVLRPHSLTELGPLLRLDPLHVLLDPLLRFGVARVWASTIALRLPAVFFGTANVAATLAVGSRIGGRRVGALSAGLLAFSMLAVEWSRRINLYSELTFWSLVSVWTLLRAAEKPGPSRFAAYALAQTAFAYTHPFAWVVGAIELGWAAGRERKALAGTAAALAFAAAAFAPWFFYAGVPGLGLRFHWTKGPDWHGWRHLWEALQGWAQRPEASAKLLPGWALATASLSGLAYAAAAAAGAASLGLRKAWTAPWLLAAALPAAGLPIVLLLDWRLGYFFATRQTLFALPFYLMLVALGLESLLAERAVWGAAAAVLFFIPVYAADLATQSEVHAYRLRAAEAVRRYAGDGDALLFRDPESAQALLYHLDRSAFLSAEPARPFDGVWRFRLSDDLRAGPTRVYCLERPGLDAAAQKERWRAIAEELASFRKAYYFSFFRDDRMLERFRAETGLRTPI